MSQIGFIGTGNMGRAMVSGMIASGQFSPENIGVTDANYLATQALEEALPGIQTYKDSIELTKKSRILVLAIKPQIYPVVIKQIAPHLDEFHLIVTIAAGVTLESVEQWCGKPVRVVRTMPNTPALVGQGMTGVCGNSRVSEEDLVLVRSLFSSFGLVEDIPQHLMDAFTALSGSSPAWVFMFIEALADGAVREGIPRDKAYSIAAQAVLGSAQMVLETGKHPGVLKDMVTSPAGTTIEAVASLESSGFRSSVMNAVKVCTERAKILSGGSH